MKRAILDNRGLAINHTGDYTVTEWCRLWFETYSKPNIRTSTAYNYNNMIENHIIPAIGAVKLRQLTSLHIQKMYNDTKIHDRVKRFEKTTDLSLSGSYVRGLHMMLHNCLQQAVKERLIPYNPCDNCRIPKKEKAEMKLIPPEQVGAYLKEAEQYGVLPIFYLALTSGLRRGELLGLLWEDLDVESRILTINKQVTRQDGVLVVSEPKTQNSIRKVAVPQQTVELLIAEHERHPDSPLSLCPPRPAPTGVPNPSGASTESCWRPQGLIPACGSTISDTPSPLSPCRAAWTPRPWPVCWGITPLGLLLTPTPM